MVHKFRIVYGQTEMVEKEVERLLNDGWDIVAIVDCSTNNIYRLQICMIKQDI